MISEKDIRTYAALMKELDLTGLEITDENSRKVRLERAAAPAVIPVREASPAAPVSAPAPAAVKDDGCVSVKSPIVGVFYAAPAENADPFVRPGEKVEKGATLCIVEAMKLMNEIQAEVSGTVEAVSVKNGQVVEYGTELFRIRPN